MSQENQNIEVDDREPTPNPKVVKKINDALDSLTLGINPNDEENSHDEEEYHEGAELSQGTDKEHSGSDKVLSGFEGDGNAFDTNLDDNADFTPNLDSTANITPNLNEEIAGSSKVRVDMSADFKETVEVLPANAEPLIEQEIKKSQSRLCFCMSLSQSFQVIIAMALGALMILGVNNPNIFGRKMSQIFTITFVVTCPVFLFVLCIFSWVIWAKMRPKRAVHDLNEVSNKEHKKEAKFTLNTNEPYV